MKIQYKKIFFACLLALIFLLPLSISIKEIKINTVSAIEVRYPTILGFSITDSSSAIDYAKYFFNIGMAIAGTLAVIAIMFGGIYYLVSLNRGKFTDEGKQWIKSGVLGLILLVSAYLIAYTINPDLVYFRLERLLPLNFLGSSGDTPLSKSSITTYEEIPLGTLTENLLSRTMDCYDYDQNGDPIEVRITTDDNNTINGPTFLNHDRADCLLKLTEAAEKKAKIVRNLSDEIVRLMSQCSCAGKCDVSTTPSCRPPVGGKCPLVGYNGAACKPFPGKSNDCCPTDSGIKNPKGGKNFTVKEIIEHGPIKVDMCKQEVRVLETFDGSNEIGGGENNESCWAPLFETKATIKKPMDFIIGPGINTGAVSKSLNEWNKRFPSNK
ncbi:MAG: pilin, partial [Candidatus Staskawiczbacteria bacterium]|nr:pilin [Candidatus Staskawiczbacteria bacterium]